MRTAPFPPALGPVRTYFPPFPPTSRVSATRPEVLPSVILRPHGQQCNLTHAATTSRTSLHTLKQPSEALAEAVCYPASLSGSSTMVRGHGRGSEGCPEICD